MGMHALLRRLTGRWQRQVESESELAGEGPADPSRMRQEHLALLRSRGIPIWSERPERCDACGRELLVGERAFLLSRGEELLLACSLCATGLLDEGALPVPCRYRSDGVEQLEIAS